MRPFRFLFPLLLVGVAAFVLFKILFFLVFGLTGLALLFISAMALRRFGPGRGRWQHRWEARYRVPAWAEVSGAEPLDPRQPQRSGEPLAGERLIEVL